MALTVTPGYEHASGGLVTPTRLNTAISGLTINMAAGKRLATTAAGAAIEVTDPILCRVTSQFDKTDTTLADVTGLSADVEAGKAYSFEATLFVTQDATGDARVGIGGSATATDIRFSVYTSPTNGNVRRQTFSALGSASNIYDDGTDVEYRISGTITVNAGGTLTVIFAQRAASGTSSVLVGSYFHVTSYA
jgi:hypothetical protein